MTTPRSFRHAAKPIMGAERGASIDLRESAWQVFRIMSEFVEGYQFLTRYSKQVTIFGSARTFPNSPFYQEAVKLGKLLAKGGYTTITGGGPGIMEAANKGAFEAGGNSIGINIQLPNEQRLNSYVQESIGCNYFLTRKVLLTTPSQAFVYFPGGFGTLDELFEVLDQMRFKQLSVAPIILMGSQFWSPVVSFLRTNVFEQIHALEEQDLSMIHVVDSAAEAMTIIKKTKQSFQVCALDASQFCSDDAVNWRVFRIMAELVEGFEFLRDIGDVITFLGTPRVKSGSTFYKDAYNLAQGVARKKFGVLTGGGVGIMEAANRGAYEMGGGSYGIEAIRSHHDRPSDFMTKSKSFYFPFTRKLMLTTPTKGFVVFPGGYGTLNVCFEILTLIQTGKIARVPIVLYGKGYWEPLLSFMQENQFEHEHTITREDLNLYTVAETPEDVLRILDL